MTNVDREIWRQGDYSIRITEGGDIGISVGGRVAVMSVEKWHELGWRHGGFWITNDEPEADLCKEIDRLEEELDHEALRAKIRYLQGRIERKMGEYW